MAGLLAKTPSTAIRHNIVFGSRRVFTKEGDAFKIEAFFKRVFWGGMNNLFMQNEELMRLRSSFWGYLTESFFPKSDQGRLFAWRRNFTWNFKDDNDGNDEFYIIDTDKEIQLRKKIIRYEKVSLFLTILWFAIIFFDPSIASSCLLALLLPIILENILGNEIAELRNNGQRTVWKETSNALGALGIFSVIIILIAIVLIIPRSFFYNILIKYSFIIFGISLLIKYLSYLRNSKPSDLL